MPGGRFALFEMPVDHPRDVLLSSAVAAKLFGVPFSNVHYWEQKRLIQPKVRSAGVGRQAVYDFRSLIELSLIVEARQTFQSLSSLQKIIQAVREAPAGAEVVSVRLTEMVEVFTGVTRCEKAVEKLLHAEAARRSASAAAKALPLPEETPKTSRSRKVISA